MFSLPSQHTGGLSQLLVSPTFSKEAVALVSFCEFLQLYYHDDDCLVKLQMSLHCSNFVSIRCLPKQIMNLTQDTLTKRNLIEAFQFRGNRQVKDSVGFTRQKFVWHCLLASRKDTSSKFACNRQGKAQKRKTRKKTHVGEDIYDFLSYTRRIISKNYSTQYNNDCFVNWTKPAFLNWSRRLYLNSLRDHVKTHLDSNGI